MKIYQGKPTIPDENGELLRDILGRVDTQEETILLAYQICSSNGRSPTNAHQASQHDIKDWQFEDREARATDGFPGGDWGQLGGKALACITPVLLFAGR